MGIQIMAVGDIFLQSKRGNTDPFTHVRDVFSQADIVFANLEAPITAKNIPAIEKASPLSISPENISFLKQANVSIVNLAHNHILDYGDDGALETFNHLENARIPYIGAGRSISECMREVVFKIKNTTVVFIGFYIGGSNLSTNKVYIAGTDEQLVRYRISELKRKYHFVVVSLHWGTENVFYPSPEQQVFARACIDEGASVTIGHHPHRLQGIEKYKKGLILYSLGNFNFMPCGVGLSPYPNLSCIADIKLCDDQSISYSLIPVQINDDYYPVPITAGPDRFEFENHISYISKPLQERIDKWWWYGEIAKPYLYGNGKSFIIRIKRYGIKHLYQMICWLCSRFSVKCYIGIVLRWLRMGKAIS
jgi:Putative enzyme of poly-gamma-glutamate biosynthesis (capsule formation)